MNDIYNPNIIVSNIINTHQEIQDAIEDSNINNDKLVKLMMKQLNQGLFLQTLPNLY